MTSLSESNSEFLRGTLIVVMLVAIAVLVVGALVYAGPLQREFEAMHRAYTAPVSKPRIASKSPARSNSRGNKGEDDSSPPPGDGGGGGGGGTSVPPAASAGEALREALKTYRPDIKHTSTITISSSGKITPMARGGLTTLDGVPMEQLRGGILLEGEKTR